MHQAIREKGGAYGSGAQQNRHLFALFSYRDPNNLETVNTFQKGIEWLCDGKFEDKALKEALLGLFSNIDTPISPGERGYQVTYAHLCCFFFAFFWCFV